MLATRDSVWESGNKNARVRVLALVCRLQVQVEPELQKALHHAGSEMLNQERGPMLVRTRIAKPSLTNNVNKLKVDMLL